MGIDVRGRSVRGGIAVPVVLELGGATMDVVVEAPAGATVGELAEALAGGPLPPGAVFRYIDGVAPAADAAVADVDLHAGSSLTFGPPQEPPTPAFDMGIAPQDVRFPCQNTEVGVGVEVGLAIFVTGGLDAGRVIPLTAGPHVLGRSLAADIHVESLTVSIEHAAIDVDEQTGAVVIADAGSLNGTRVDGALLPVRRPLRTRPAGGRRCVATRTQRRLAPRGARPPDRRGQPSTASADVELISPGHATAAPAEPAESSSTVVGTAAVTGRHGRGHGARVGPSPRGLRTVRSSHGARKLGRGPPAQPQGSAHRPHV